MSVTSDDLRLMLREKHSGNQWALFEEVHDSTGHARSRSCDAIAMHLWPSKGLEIHGYEIKVSRADFLNELRDPDKAETFKQYCDRWWLVAANKSIVVNDLPAGWGMLWPRDGKLVVSAGAPKLEPKPLPRPMIAALLRRASQGNPTQGMLDKRYRAGLRAGKQGQRRELERLQRECARLSKRVADFEEASGVKLGKWGNGKDVGAAVKMVLGLQARFGPLQDIVRYSRLLESNSQKLIAGLRELCEAAKAAGIQGEFPLGDAE